MAGSHMKISITFKTPDALDYAVKEIVDQQHEEDDAPWDEYESEEREEALKEKFKKWVEYGELITVDFDLEAGTATVKELS
jgi:hypothetical protein